MYNVMYGVIQIYHNYKKSKHSYLLKNLINIKLYAMLLKEALNTINPHILWQTPEQFSYPL